MSLGPNRRLRVFGRLTYTPDSRGRRRPLAQADFILTALETGPNGLTPIVSLSNPFRVRSDENGNFDRSLPWETPGNVNVQPLPEPEGFDVEVEDPDSGIKVQGERVLGDGDNMDLNSGIAPDDRPLAGSPHRDFYEVSELAAFLALALADPRKFGHVSLARPFFLPENRLDPTAAERLFRHFGNLLDRLQALHSQRSPNSDPNRVDDKVPLGFAPLEKLIVSTIYWHGNIPAAERVRKLVASYAAGDVGDEVLRRNIARLIGMLGKILQMPLEYKPNEYLWEDMAVTLTLFAGIGFVAQRNRVVWADYQDLEKRRDLTVSMR